MPTRETNDANAKTVNTHLYIFSLLFAILFIKKEGAAKGYFAALALNE
jgi:hypothetical protein